MMVNVCIRLDYPGVGPEHSFLKDIGRAEYHSVTDEDALEGIRACHRLSLILNKLKEVAFACRNKFVVMSQWSKRSRY